MTNSLTPCGTCGGHMEVDSESQRNHSEYEPVVCCQQCGNRYLAIREYDSKRGFYLRVLTNPLPR